MSFVLCLILILLVPLAIAGLALINQGLGRSRSAAHTMVATLCVLAVTSIVFLLIGFSFTGVAGGQAHVVTLARFPWNWAAAEPLFARGVRFDGTPVALVLCFQLFAVGLTAIIPLGTGSDRWRLAPACVSSACLAKPILALSRNEITYMSSRKGSNLARAREMERSRISREGFEDSSCSGRRLMDLQRITPTVLLSS